MNSGVMDCRASLAVTRLSFTVGVQLLQSHTDDSLIKRKSEMHRRPFQPGQMGFQMVKNASLHAQCFQQLERLAGARQKAALDAPFSPFGLGCGVRSGATKATTSASTPTTFRLHLSSGVTA
ncbi:MAG: hypothetical protein AUK51_14980 [Comamonadaceae bacterium CG2_30_59_20]|nr:MAG: hypothetical protein AUK51_14980 [Comamonadaceae bacterium CG2_30_59_20]